MNTGPGTMYEAQQRGTRVGLNRLDRRPYVTVTYGGAGYFAVLLCWNEDHGGFWEPWETGFVRSPFKDVAAREAKEWAAAENLEYRE